MTIELDLGRPTETLSALSAVRMYLEVTTGASPARIDTLLRKHLWRLNELAEAIEHALMLKLKDV